MRPILTDRVAWSVGLSVTLLSPAKTAEPIVAPSGLRTWLGPRDHVLDGSSDPPMGRGKFLGDNGRPMLANTTEPVSYTHLRAHNPNDISIRSAVFAGLSSVTDRPTDNSTRSVTIGRIYVCSTVRCGLTITFCVSPWGSQIQRRWWRYGCIS